jgi:hypothetical protein
MQSSGNEPGFIVLSERESVGWLVDCLVEGTGSEPKKCPETKATMVSRLLKTKAHQTESARSSNKRKLPTEIARFFFAEYNTKNNYEQSNKQPKSDSIICDRARDCL